MGKNLKPGSGADPGRADDNLETENSDSVDPEIKPGVDQPEEIGGRDGPDPTRYGDWEKNGRCIDF